MKQCTSDVTKCYFISVTLRKKESLERSQELMRSVTTDWWEPLLKKEPFHLQEAGLL